MTPGSFSLSRKLMVSMLCLAIPALLVGGCSKKQETTQTTRTETVRGKVTSFEDQTPADGPVTVIVQTDDGQTRTLRFGSMFTNPPPTPERTQLYERVRVVKVGDVVEVQATPQDDVYEIQSIVVTSSDTTSASIDTAGAKAVVTNPTELRVAHSGKVYTYHVGDRFTLVLDANTYPQAHMSFEPGGVISVDSNIPQVAPPNYAAEFVAVAPGEVVLKNGNFSVTIRVVS